MPDPAKASEPDVPKPSAQALNCADAFLVAHYATAHEKRRLLVDLARVLDDVVACGLPLLPPPQTKE